VGLVRPSGAPLRVGPDLLAAPDRVAELGCSLGHPMHVLAATVSTNDEALRAAREGAPHGATWVTEHQSGGRGRRGREWVSPAGEGLLFSVVLRLSCAPARLPPIALVAGLAVRVAVMRAVPGVDVKIKWPNDVLVAGRKIAGILIETVTVGSSVQAVALGVGINVHTRIFPDPIAATATSVALLSQVGPPDRASLLADTLASLDRDLHVVVARGLGLFRARLDAADGLRGLRVAAEAGDLGVASGIDDDGNLLVRRDDGTLARWNSGEVRLAGSRSSSPLQ
jgi:BirA family transcriptional regulator, biotin operon repressor / biotin---[acetyl-CoA-carboxylase] ligase